MNILWYNNRFLISFLFYNNWLGYITWFIYLIWCWIRLICLLFTSNIFNVFFIVFLDLWNFILYLFSALFWLFHRLTNILAFYFRIIFHFGSFLSNRWCHMNVFLIIRSLLWRNHNNFWWTTNHFSKIITEFWIPIKLLNGIPSFIIFLSKHIAARIILCCSL